MLVSTLRKLLEDLPGEMGVYLPDGKGLESLMHVHGTNLMPVTSDKAHEQFCELAFFGMKHTEQGNDAKILRETGFANRDQLLKAYKDLQLRLSAEGAPSKEEEL